jgi:magnesium-protoporphyrin IX monomethyl ester (oxidative) cyclase
MKRSGCGHIVLPIESGNQNTLNNIIRKNVDLSHARRILRMCKDLAFRTEAFFILGLPGEKRQDMIDTIRFAASSEIDIPRLFVAVPFPGSRLYDECVRKGYLTEYYDLSRLQVSSTRTNLRTAVIKTEDFSPDDVIKLRTIGYKIIKERNFEKYEEELRAV